MRGLIDAHMIGTREGGNETYVAGLLRGYETLQPVDTSIIALYRRGWPETAPGPVVRSLAILDDQNIKRLFWQLPNLSRQLGADVLHVTYNAPLSTPCATVVSVHDVIYRRYPSYFSPRVRILLNTLLPLSMRRATLILTISEASRAEIAHYYPWAAPKVRVVPIAAGPLVDSSTNPDAEAVAVTQLSGGRPFILAVGTVQPRKNIARLIAAYISLRDRDITTAKLIIVGQSAWQSSQIEAIATQSPYAEDIVFAGYQADSTLAALYRACAVFAYPSLYEGFGLPVVEAMACGAPVVAGTISSIPEVAGDAALLVDPLSADAIGDAIKQILTDAALAASLRERGRRRAAQFTWSRSAQQTLEVYREASARFRAASGKR